ncbi:hypothetical protein [Streptomyces sp. NPDC014623]|uniref:hypothetical protein n=1 Tax=Streptomyces sp. NPDC014623 TaxID=3364875 RepID=UPI0036FA5802
MPSLGSIKRSCVGEAAEEVKAFALAFQEVLPQVLPGATMAEKARALGVSSSLLSHWLHGRRLPRSGISRALGPLVQDGRVGEEGRTGQVLARLEGLLQAARSASCRRCAGECACRQKSPQGDRRNEVDGRADKGDRRNSGSTGMEDSTLPGRLAALSLADRAASLWSLGASLDEDGIGELVAALGRVRMRSEMEVILRSAEYAGRDPVKITLAASMCLNAESGDHPCYPKV